MVDKMQGGLVSGIQSVSRFLHIHQLHTGRIGNRHGESVILRHGQKRGIQPGATGHAERNVGQTEDGFAFKGFAAPANDGQGFFGGLGV